MNGNSEKPAVQSVGIYSDGHHEPAPYTQRVYDWAEAPSQQAAIDADPANPHSQFFTSIKSLKP